MVQENSKRLIPALLLLACSGVASASGFQSFEQNASGIGNAYSGSAAVADNASTIFFNPAGMTQLQAHEISGGLTAVDSSVRFNDKGSSVGALAGTGDGGDAGNWLLVPNGYLSWALNKDWYVGIGIGRPFGVKNEYNDSWLGAAQATLFEIKTVNINPSVAYRVNDKVSLGFGLNWQRAELDYQHHQSTASTAPWKLTLDDDSWGWNAGALFTISPSTKVGVSYRSAIKYDLTGKIASTTPGNAKASLKLPGTFILSVSQKLSDKWEMLGDASWTGWNSISNVNILRSSGALEQSLNTDFRNTWRVALGANYKFNDAWKLKYGVAYDQTPVQRAANRQAFLPDNDRFWLSIGAQWAPSKTSALDLGLSYIIVKDSRINNSQATFGRVTGDYEANNWLLGAQYSLSF